MAAEPVQKSTVDHIATSDREAKYIIEDIREAKNHVLLIPPRFDPGQLEITSPPGNEEVYVGLFTSGSTGSPKLIWNRRSAIVENGRISQSLYDISPQMELLIIASPWHVAGLSWALMAEEAGNNYQITVPRIEKVSEWNELIHSMQPDMLLTVPSVLRYLYGYSDWFVPRIAYGGASLLSEDYEKLAPHGHMLYQGYGQTEAGGVISAHKRSLLDEPDMNEAACVGVPPSPISVSCRGFRENPEPVSVQSPTAVYKGWYDTGDRGFMDEAGKLYLKGRNDRPMGNCNTITAVTEVVHK